MEWKKIAKAILRMAPPMEGSSKSSKGSKSSRGVSPNKREDEVDDKPPAKHMRNKQTRVALRTPRTLQNLSLPTDATNGSNPSNLSNLTSSKSESGATAAAPAVVTFGSSCSRPLPRWQVLYSLLSDCHRSPRRIDLLVLHCTDTRPNQDFTFEKLAASHRARMFGDYPGYHLYVRRDGSLFYCRPVSMMGCHVKGYNRFSIGICYEGGHSCSPEYKYEDNRTAEQMVVLDEILTLLHEAWPEARIVGHSELDPRKACPCLDPPASVEYSYIYS